MVRNEHNERFQPFSNIHLLKSIYISSSVLRLITCWPETKFDFRCLFARPEKVLVSVNNFIPTSFLQLSFRVSGCRLITVLLEKHFGKYCCATTRRWFLYQVSHCSSVFWYWPIYPEPSLKIPTSSQPLLTLNRVLWWTTTAVWRKARVKCWLISKLKLIPSLQSPAKVFYIFRGSV